MKNINLEVFKGNSFIRQLVFVKNVAPQNITGWTIYFTIKNKLTDPDSAAILQQTITSFTNPTGGIHVINISPATMEELLGVFQYDITYKDTDGTVKTFMDGSITINMNATRRAS